MRLACPLRNGFLLLGLAVATAGCFLDEIDKASEWQNKKPEPKEAPAPQTQTAAPKTNWWASAKSLGSEESKADIVNCDVGNSTQFTNREDCLARGGTIK